MPSCARRGYDREVLRRSHIQVYELVCAPCSFTIKPNRANVLRLHSTQSGHFNSQSSKEDSKRSAQVTMAQPDVLLTIPSFRSSHGSVVMVIWAHRRKFTLILELHRKMLVLCFVMLSIKKNQLSQSDSFYHKCNLVGWGTMNVSFVYIRASINLGAIC